MQKNPKHVPQRMCICCRRSFDRQQLLRLVRDERGQLQPDPTGRAPGRGAYICADPQCRRRFLRPKDWQKLQGRAAEDKGQQEAYVAKLSMALVQRGLLPVGALEVEGLDLPRTAEPAKRKARIFVFQEPGTGGEQKGEEDGRT